MENTQFSILTALFGGKSVNGAQAGGAGLFAAPAEGGESQGQGFFSFIEGLLTPRPETNVEGEGGQSPEAPFIAPGFAVSRNMKILESEDKTGEMLGAGMIPVTPAPSAGGEIAGGETIVAATGEGAAKASLAPGIVATTEAPDAALAAHALAQKTEFAAEGAAAAANNINPKAAAAAEAPVAALAGAQILTDDAGEAPEVEIDPETPRGRTGEFEDGLIAPRFGTKTQAAAAISASKAAFAIREHAAPEALLHSAVTRDEGGIEFDRLASSRIDHVSTADRTLHLNPVRDQIVAAVAARHHDGKLEVRLDPPELGRVTIGFEQDGAEMVRAVISADTPETLDLMRRHADVFQRALEDQGFAGLDLHFAERGPNEHSADEARGKAQGFSLTEEETAASVAVQAGLEAGYGRLDRRM